MGTRQDNLWSLGRQFHFGNIGTDPIRLTVVFPWHLFTTRQQGLSAAQVNNQIATFIATDNAVNHFTDAITELVVNPFALSLTNLLNNDLLGHLSSDTAEGTGFHHHAEGVTNFNIRIDFPRFADIDFFI